ncbi:cation transporter [Pseudomonas taiwanensis SJ9]|uniref:Cation transporter n=5 Tax=Pseudomonas TaxID=286 RepID=V7DC44_9PSED|nr:cation transporter [Pseudomonas taiwanensis SJ9]
MPCAFALSVQKMSSHAWFPSRGALMNLHQLNTEARAGHVDELNLIAIEGGDYLLEARIKGHPHPLSDTRGERLRVHSVEDARKLLQTIPMVSMNLVHWSVQDEMCGMGTHPEEDLKVPISQRSAW